VTKDGVPRRVDPSEDTTPIELVDARVRFDPSAEGLVCVLCLEHLVWSSASQAWVCDTKVCRWRGKLPEL
jgi:hypothetical protein